MGELRRDKGTGMVRRRADGRWEGRYVDADGRKRSVYVRSRGEPGSRDDKRAELECEKLVGERIEQASAGLRPSNQPLADYVARWVARHPKLSAQTRQRYGELIRIHLRPTDQGAISVVRLQPDDLEDLYAARIVAGMAPKSVELLHTVIRGALSQAARRGHALRNAAADVATPAIPKRKREVFTLVEVRRILAVGDRLTALWTLAYSVPIREGELLGLTWADVDLDRARLVLQDPEKDGVPRTLILPAATVRALRSHKARQGEERLATGGAYEETNLVFATLTGDRLDPRRVREAFARVLAAAQAPAKRVHDLRHTGITHLLEAGVPLKVVQEIAGHRSSRTTIETYAHVTETMQDQAVAAMDRALGS